MGSRWAAALLIAASLVPFANGLGGDFTYDDKAIVRDNPRIRSAATFGQLFETSYFGGPHGTGTAYRPMLLASFAVEWWIHGGKALPFHAANLLFHAAATLLLWRLLVALAFGEAVSLAASLLFAVHPIHVEAVTSLVGRGETQSAVFVLLFLHLAVRWWRRPERRRLRLCAALLCYAVALLTKESAAAAPALAALCFLRLEEGTAARRLGRALLRGAPLYAGAAAVLAGFFGLREWVLGGFLHSGNVGIFEVENPLAALRPFARVANAALVLLRYVGRIVFPLRLSADESAWSIRPVAAASLPAIAAVVLFGAAVLLALARPRAVAAFGLLFFLGAILPASNLFFATGTIFAERVAYLPAAGLCLIAGSALAAPGGPRALLAAAAVLLAARTAARGMVWWSDERLFENSARVAPESAKSRYNLGYIRAEHARDAEGLASYARATDIYPKYWDAWAGKGKCERDLGRYEEARRSYAKSLEALASYENGFFGLGLVCEAEGRDAEALATYRRGLLKNPDSLPLVFRASTVASRLGDPAAGRWWKRALAAHPESLPTRFGYTQWLRTRGDEGFRVELWRILAAAPRDAGALRLAAEDGEARGHLFGAALARERIFRGSRTGADLRRLLAAADASPAYARRFDALRRRLEREAPWAFTSAAAKGFPGPSVTASASPGSRGGG
ncbi:MAG TPA: hypothetical protein VIA45_18440 [Thermoanaerobaculia bacterium]